MDELEEQRREMKKPHLATRGRFIWKFGVLRWGGFMFTVFGVLGPLIPHFTMGKPVTVGLYISDAIISAIIIFPAGAVYGWALWSWAKRKRKSSAA